MKVITAEQKQQLIKNGSPGERSKDHFPVVKLFMPGLPHTWLLTELDPEEPTVAFGLCDLGMGFPEQGYVDLDEISSVRGPFGYVERDDGFVSKYPLSVYVAAASEMGLITEQDVVLSRHVKPSPKP